MIGRVPNTKLRAWLLEGEHKRAQQMTGGKRETKKAEQPWWKVMCLTGVDYFSTLGYQPGIAALAAGVLSPLATVVLVVLTLAGALPIYRRVARESPHGQGSIAMLEKLLSRWGGKLLVLALLGFAATDFVITVTLSAADATAHVIENPFVPAALHGGQVWITLVLIALLGAVFLKGFAEAIGVAVVLVGVYLALNVVVVVTALAHVFGAPQLIVDWQNLLISEHPNPWLMVGVALVVFPKLALGLSGFETGVSVMPLVRGASGDTEADPVGRIRNTRRLLLTAALIMSAFLITSSFATAVLIPQQEFQAGGKASGRALAYLAHSYLGDGFGTVYDVSTIAILWFAGASAMAGLLNIVPRYLPRYGMAPDWARATRPLVIVVSVIAFVITLIFDADVEAQGGAYATGVLVLISSASVAVALSARRLKQRAFWAYLVITLVFLYTTVANIVERPEGVKIAGFFIGAIVVTSLISRATRSLELRVEKVEFDAAAQRIVDKAVRSGAVRIIANEPDARDAEEYREKEQEAREDNHIPRDSALFFLEVTISDASDFETTLRVHGEKRAGYRILRMKSPSIANAIAAVLLHLRDETGMRPHIYFAWTEGNPFKFLVRYLFSGDGDVPPVTREVLRRAEPDPHLRPLVHVG
ncbi:MULTISPECIES: APC family permease [Amycolatopsis]|uniref:APC family permease n=1 Tax=Amycolatopsis dendrobii TaxID=2760662 RepID=A0A7W3ZD33_9PSEU|nr:MULTISPECIES: APC family permease [Amycolatopsis]MBB1156990.1 APC family permease [Amycolatopsis dendrobii]UKD53698.1 amino acid transporter [Amycolatopsis sp. FU40]